jgi:MFS family permease
MVLAAAMLVTSTLVDGNPAFVLVALALVGVGLGAFTPPNNAAIMGAAPPAFSGLASGVLNMTRGLGTSLGLAVAGIAYTVGTSSSLTRAGQAIAGYRYAALVLGATAALAAFIAALRGHGPLCRDPAVGSE